MEADDAQGIFKIKRVDIEDLLKEGNYVRSYRTIFVDLAT